MDPPGGCNGSSIGIGQWKPGMTFGDFAEVRGVHRTSQQGRCCHHSHAMSLGRGVLTRTLFWSAGDHSTQLCMKPDKLNPRRTGLYHVSMYHTI